MRKGVRGFCIVAATAVLAVAPTHAADQIPAIAAVINHMTEKDYPEVFAKTPYVVKVENTFMFDLDRDGQDEVVLHVTPHYRQSATILFYRVSPDMKVTRLREGLAPGPLVPLSGDFLDAHALGEAIDLDLKAQQHDEPARKKFIDSLFSQSASVVAYRDFFHMDTREGVPYYVDMTSAEPKPKRKTCEEFEFSQVKEAAIGTVDGLGDEPVLATWAAQNVYLYRFGAVSPEGMLEKTHWTVKLPSDFAGLIHNAVPHPLAYVTSDGTTKPFTVACESDRQNNCVLKSSP